MLVPGRGLLFGAGFRLRKAPISFERSSRIFRCGRAAGMVCFSAGRLARRGRRTGQSFLVLAGRQAGRLFEGHPETVAAPVTAHFGNGLDFLAGIRATTNGPPPAAPSPR